MKLLRASFIHPVGYALLLALAAAFFLYGVGLRADSLPFPPRADFSDAVVSHWPSSLFMQRSLQAGAVPLWRPNVMSGQPFAANPLNKVWYPLQWLVAILPPTLHLNVMLWLHLVIAGLGMRWLGRTLGFTFGIANVMGLAYMAMPRLIAAAGAGHLDVVYAMAWLPYVLASVVQITSVPPADQPPGRWSRLRQTAVFGLVTAMCFLADIRICVFAVGLAVSFAARSVSSPVITSTPQQRDHFVRQHLSPMLVTLWSGLILALLLTAVQWMQLMEILPYATRIGLSPEEAGVFSLEAPQLLGAILPRQPGSHETILYSGILLLILGIIGTIELFRAKRWGIALFWWLIIVFATLYALGTNGFLWSGLVALVPPLAWLRVPPRIWCLAIVGLIILAGYGIQALSSVHFRLKSDQRAVFVGIVGLLIIAELLWTDVVYIVGKPQSQWLDPYARIAQTLLDDGVTRFYSPTYSFPQQAASYWRIPDFGGVDPLQLRGYVVEFEQATGTRVNSYTVTLPPLDSTDLRTANQNAVIDAQKLREWGVSHVVSAYPLTTIGLEQITLIDGVYIYRNIFAIADLPVATANPNCQPPPPDFPYLPGWYGRSLSVDAPNDLFGERLLCYSPITLMPSLAVSGIGTLICLGLFIIGGRRA